MIAVTVSLVNAPEIAARLGTLAEGLQSQILEDGLLTAGLVVQNAAKINAPLLHGNLRDSIHTELVGDHTVAIGTDLVYARIQEFGGDIYPVNVQVLHWVDAGGGEHFARHVHIPAQPYLRPALDENINEIVGAFGASVQAALDRVAA